MNFLAHTFLSGTSDEILVGNFIGDFVKGRQLFNFPETIQKGIIIHRNIDKFTDIHKVVKQSKSFFLPAYGKYSGIVVDIIYDHFLALFWNNYIEISLEEYIESVHKRLEAFYDVFPDNVKEFFPKFVKNNWIRSYASTAGIEKVLFGMSRHTSLPQKTKTAMEILMKNYDAIGEDFQAFFPEIINYVRIKHHVSFEKPFRPYPSSYAIPA